MVNYTENKPSDKYWTETTEGFDTKDSIIIKNHQTYQITSKYKHQKSLFQRVSTVATAILKNILTLPLIICSPSKNWSVCSTRMKEALTSHTELFLITLYTEPKKEEPKQEEKKKPAEFETPTAGLNNEEVKTDSKLEEVKKPELTAEQQQAFKDFGENMVEALGGIDRVMAIPVLEKWDTVMSMDPHTVVNNNPNQLHDHMTAPIMRYYNEKGQACLIFCYLKYRPPFINDKGMFYKSIEVLSRRDNSWTADTHKEKELKLSIDAPIDDNSLSEKYMLDRVKRLSNKECIGKLEKYKDVAFVKPENLTRPDNAYLNDEQFKEYSTSNTLFYELDATKDFSHTIVLIDPKLKEAEFATFVRELQKERLEKFREKT